MSDHQHNCLVEFHHAFGHPVRDGDMEDIHLLSLRRELIREEARELDEAIQRCHPYILCGEEIPLEVKADLLKEMADLLYVLRGMAVVFALPLDEGFNRVHASNMSKLGTDGKPVYREDGKIMKGPNYAPPKLDDLFT